MPLLLASVFLAVVVVELGYIVMSPNENSKKRINRRMSIGDGKDKMSQKNILLQLRKERGLDENGMLVMPMKSLNKLILRSGITLGLKKAWALLRHLPGRYDPCNIHLLAVAYCKHNLASNLHILIAIFLVKEKSQ